MHQKNHHRQNSLIHIDIKVRTILTTLVICFFTILGSIYFGDRPSGIFDKFMVKVYSIVNKPLQKIAYMMDMGINCVYYHDTVSNLLAENAELKASELRLQIAERENEELKLLNSYIKPLNFRYITSEIMSASASQYGSNITLNIGNDQGVSEGEAVLTSEGIIGRIIKSSSTKSNVALLNNVNFRVPVFLLKSGIRCVAVGGDDSQYIELLYVTNPEEIIDGEIAVTSGEGGMMPFGIKVGTVLRTSLESGECVLKPAARLNVFHIVAVASPVSR